MTGSKWAASMSTLVVEPPTSDDSPPMTPAMARGVSDAVDDEQVLGVRVRSTSSRVVRVSPARARRVPIDPDRVSRSKACSG